MGEEIKITIGDQIYTISREHFNSSFEDKIDLEIENEFKKNPDFKLKTKEADDK